MKNRGDLIFIFIMAVIAAILALLMFFPREVFAESKDTYIPESQQEICYELGEQYGICPELLMAIIECESSGKMSATNGTCYGICQINGAVWGYTYTSEYDQIKKCCEILISYDLPVDEALSKYNGQSNYNYEGYVKKVLDRTHELELVHYGM